MKSLLKFLILALLVQNGLSCGGGKDDTDNPPEKEPEKTPEEKPEKPSNDGPGNAVKNKLGPNVDSEPYDPSGVNNAPGGFAQSGDDLKCDFESSCCWQNVKPPKDQMEWGTGSGEPDSDKLKENFGTDQKPSGKFLMTATDKAAGGDEQAQFISCPLACTNQEIEVSVKHWATEGVKLQVCEKDASSEDSELMSCQDLSGDAPGPATAKLPPGENINLVIVASNLVKDGSIALIDDIEVKAEKCPDPTTVAPAETTAGGAGPCASVTCNFDAGDTCAYQNAQSPPSGGPQGGKLQQWEISDKRYKNPSTGVRKPVKEGDKYAACYLYPKDQAILETQGDFTEERVVKFQRYKAVDKVELKGCCDDASNCPYSTEKDVQLSDYNQWKPAGFNCPGGTKKVVFYGTNTGPNEGAIGIDDIQLFVPSGGNPEDAQQPAC